MLDWWMWLLIVAAIVVAVLLIWKPWKPKPLLMRKFEVFDTKGDVPDVPNAAGIYLQVGMQARDAGATVAWIDAEEKSTIVTEHVNDLDDLPDYRKDNAIGIMLFFNAKEEIEYEPQEVRLVGTARHGTPIDVTVSLPRVRGRDGENAYFYLDTKGRAYGATQGQRREAAPTLDWQEALTSAYRVRLV